MSSVAKPAALGLFSGAGLKKSGSRLDEKKSENILFLFLSFPTLIRGKLLNKSLKINELLLVRRVGCC